MKQKTTSKSKVCFGISNETEDKMFIPFFDFDNIDFSDVDKSIIDIQIKYLLSDIYLFKTKNGYNAICFDKFNIVTLEDIMKNTKNICNDFVRLANARGFYVLRMSFNKEFVCHYAGTELRECSNAHFLFLKDVMKYPILEPEYKDKLTKLTVYAYRSAKHGFCEVSL